MSLKMITAKEGKMAIKVDINGFGRIGRNVFRTAIGDPDIDFVAVNDLTDTKALAHLLKYDSVLENLNHEISATETGIRAESDEFRVFSEKDPAVILWEEIGAEVNVLDVSAQMTDFELNNRSRPESADWFEEADVSEADVSPQAMHRSAGLFEIGAHEIRRLDRWPLGSEEIFVEIFEDNETDIYLCKGLHANDQVIGKGFKRYSGGAKRACVWHRGRWLHQSIWQLRALPVDDPRSESRWRGQGGSRGTPQSRGVPTATRKDLPVAAPTFPQLRRLLRLARPTARCQSDSSGQNPAVQSRVIYSDIRQPYSTQHPLQLSAQGKDGTWLYRRKRPDKAGGRFYEGRTASVVARSSEQTQRKAKVCAHAKVRGSEAERHLTRDVTLSTRCV
jgi:hypothetical protein